jgi:outer membrane protein assembly factor BamB
MAPGHVTAEAADWPNYRGPRHDGIAPDVTLPKSWPRNGPPVIWKAQTATGFSSIAVAEGRVYTMGNRDDQDFIFCLKADTGDELWTYGYAAPLDPNLYEGGPNATPTVDGDTVLTLSRRGEVHCLDAATGDVRWSKNVQQETGASIPGWGFSSSPLVQGRLVLFGIGPAGLALDKTTGEVVWSSGTEECGYTTPVPFEQGGRSLVLVTSGTQLSAVDTLTGELNWQYRWITRYGVNAADPIVMGDEVFISSGYSKGAGLIRVTANEPVEVWRIRQLRNQLNASVLVDGYLYGIDGDTTQQATLQCVSWKTGQVEWSEKGVGSGSLIAADGHLIVLSDKGKLGVIPASPSGFRPVTGAQILSGKCWTSPALAEGRLFARNAAGTLVCVDLRPGD